MINKTAIIKFFAFHYGQDITRPIEPIIANEVSKFVLTVAETSTDKLIATAMGSGLNALYSLDGVDQFTIELYAGDPNSSKYGVDSLSPLGEFEDTNHTPEEADSFSYTVEVSTKRWKSQTGDPYQNWLTIREYTPNGCKQTQQEIVVRPNTVIDFEKGLSMSFRTEDPENWEFFPETEWPDHLVEGQKCEHTYLPKSG